MTTMGQLAGYSYEELMKLRGVGKVIADGITEAVEKWNEKE